MKIKFAVRSDVGRVRTNNEDNFFCNGIFMTVLERERPFFLSGFIDKPCIFAVCDGMGGEDCGELASLTTVEALSKHSQNILSNNNGGVQNFVKDANEKLCAVMNEQNLRMGTTLALAVMNEKSFSLYNIGDSRIYRLTNERLLRVTDDHTLAEEKVRMGLITPEKAEKDRDRHVLTRYLGIDEHEYGSTVSPDVYDSFNYDENKRILLCSDGLTEMLSYKDISTIMKKTSDVSDIVNNLVDAALFNGGRDNVTCIVAEIVKGG